MFKKQEVTDRPAINQMNGLLDKGCSFRGRLTFDGAIQINGDFEGEIFSDGTLIIGPEARVNAKVSVDTLVVMGQLQGEVDAKTRIEMRVPARVQANVSTTHLSVQDGVMFLGQCHMEAEATQELPRLQPQVGEEAEDVMVM